MKLIQLLFCLFIGIASNPLSAQETFIYVSDAGNWSSPPWQVLKYDIQGDFVGIFTNEAMAWPQDIIFLDSTVLISNLNSGQINLHHAKTGQFIEVFANNIGGPTRMKIGVDSLLYALQWSGNGLVKRYNLNGDFIDDYTDSTVTQAIGLDWDSNRNLYVSSFDQKTIERFDSSGAWIETFIDSGLAGPTNIWFNDTGDLIINDYSSGTVKYYNENGIYIATLVTGVSECEGFALMDDHSWLIGHGSNASVKHYNPDGSVIEALIPSGLGGLLRPNAVIIHEEVVSDTTDSSTSVSSLQTPSAHIVPQMGQQFSISNGIEHVKRVQVWDMNGKMIAQPIPNSNVVWDASTTSEGVYFIVAEMSDGELIRQRVVRTKP